MAEDTNLPKNSRFEDDAILIAAIQADGVECTQAWEFVFKKHLGMVIKLLWKQSYFKALPDEHERKEEAYDVLSEVFFSIKKSKGKIKGRFSTYLFACLRNECWKRGKKHGRPKPSHKIGKSNARMTPEEPGGETSEENTDGTVRIRAAIEYLGEPCRTLLAYTTLGYASKEIADTINEKMADDKQAEGVSVAPQEVGDDTNLNKKSPPKKITDDWVRKRLSDCREKLKTLLENPKF